jgi:hypothetical protein
MHCFRFISGYRHGLTERLLDYAVKECKSHRSIAGNLIDEIENKYRVKLEQV